MIKFNFDSFDINIIKVIIANFALILLIILIKIYKNYKQDKSFFYRERPQNLSVAIANYYYKGKVTKDTIYLTLLDLISKGYYKLEKNGKEYTITWQKDELLNLDKYDLNSFEKELANYINVIMIDKKSNKISIKDLKNTMSFDLNIKIFVNKFYNLLKEEIKKSTGIINSDKNYLLMFLVTFIYFYLIFSPSTIIGFSLGAIYTLIIMCISMILKNTKLNPKGIMGIIFIIYFLAIISIPFIPNMIESNNLLLIFLLIINPILILANIVIINIKFYNSKQKELVKEINGLKNFLTEFSELAKKDFKYIILFKQYYAFAVALGVKLENVISDNLEYDDIEFNTLTSEEFLDIVSDIVSDLILNNKIISKRM